MVIILTYEKVLKAFKDYLTEDGSCEVLQSSRGYLVVDWDSCKDNWVTARLCNTPALLCDTLRSHYEEYQGYRLTDGYKRPGGAGDCAYGRGPRRPVQRGQYIRETVRCCGPFLL